MDDDARVGRDRERRRVGDRVRDADRLDLERADANGARAARLDEPRVLEDLVLAQPLADEPERVAAAPRRARRKRRRRYGQRADVVLVTVGDDDAGDALAIRLERGEVGVDDVDAEAAVVERDAAVDEHDLAALLERQAVHADLAEAAERRGREH